MLCLMLLKYTGYLEPFPPNIILHMDKAMMQLVRSAFMNGQLLIM